MSIRHKSTTNKKAIFKCETRGQTFQKMQNFFKDRKFCDVVLVAGNDNTRVSAHRIVLSAASEYFLDLLDKSTTSEITLEQVDGEILHLLVNFIYTATLEINGDTVDNIMRTASLLKLDAVVNDCSDYLAGKLSHSNCLLVAAFSQQQNYPDLCEKSFMYACQHFSELFKEESFLQLEIETLCKLLSRNDLCVTSEEEVFYGVTCWLRHDKGNRDKFTFQLLSHVRFALLNPIFIAKEIEEICQSPDCQALIIKAFKWHISPSSRSLYPAEYDTPRNQKREIILIKGGEQIKPYLTAEVFDPLVSQWTYQKWPAFRKTCSYTSGHFINGKVYLAGTRVNSEFNKISCVHCLNLSTEEWYVLPPMNTVRCSFAMAELNGELYAVGGISGTDNLCSVEKWNRFQPQGWQVVAPMRATRSQPAVAVLNGRLYAIGCVNDFDNNIFEFYDPQTNTWSGLEPPVQIRTSVGLTAISGYLYAVGGRSEDGDCNLVERYDPDADNWTEITPSGKFQRYQQCAASLDRLIVLVEVNEGRAIHILEEYNPNTEQWRILNPLQRHHGSVILISK